MILINFVKVSSNIRGLFNFYPTIFLRLIFRYCVNFFRNIYTVCKKLALSLKNKLIKIVVTKIKKDFKG